MAVANTFTFGGVITTTYNVLVEGPGDYSGAKKAVEMISIPGRDGAFALDKGYFENEPVEYDVLIQGATQATFETAVSSFRNAILSKKGYQRLTDTYHPNEYRMAVYAGGFDEEPKFHGKGASFKVKFDCKPQRWLTSGETATAVASGGTVTNPTLFPSSPLLEVKGYGDIEFNGFKIKLDSGGYGDVTILDNQKFWENGYSVTIPSEYIKNGDTITISGLAARSSGILANGYSYNYSAPNTAPDPTDSGSGATTVYLSRPDGPLYGTNSYTCMTNFADIVFTIGTSDSVSDTYTIDDIAICQWISGTKYDKGVTDITVTTTVTYDAATQTITFTQSGSATGNATSNIVFRIFGQYASNPSTIGSLIVNSTITFLGDPTCIDCDLGAAYKDENGVIISLNKYIDLGSDLPKLAPGVNTITYDNTITELKVTPRWAKV